MAKLPSRSNFDFIPYLPQYDSSLIPACASSFCLTFFGHPATLPGATVAIHLHQWTTEPESHLSSKEKVDVSSQSVATNVVCVKNISYSY